MQGRRFKQVDVFTRDALRGNPVAVVLDAAGLADDVMQRFAAWTNLSETTFVLPPSVPEADYRVRIFTPTLEAPFAGHPTLGTCHAWLAHGGQPKRSDVIVQECGIGLVPVRKVEQGLAFAAPPLLRSGPLEEAQTQRIAGLLGIEDLREVSVFERCYSAVLAKYPAVSARRQLYETIRRMVDYLVSDLIVQSERNIAHAMVDSIDAVRIGKMRAIISRLRQGGTSMVRYAATRNPSAQKAE